MSKVRRRFGPEDRLPILQDRCRRVDPLARGLEDENDRLKSTIAKQALQIEVRGEL